MKDRQFCFCVHDITTKRYPWIIIFYAVLRSVQKPLDTWGEEMHEKWLLNTCGRYKTLCQFGKLNIPQSIIVLYWLQENDNVCIYWIDSLVFKSRSTVSFCFLRRQNFPPVTWCCFCMKCPFGINFTCIFTFPFINIWRSHPVKIAFGS